MPSNMTSRRQPRKISAYTNKRYGLCEPIDYVNDTDFPEDAYFDPDMQLDVDFDIPETVETTSAVEVLPNGKNQEIRRRRSSAAKFAVNTIVNGDCREVLRHFPSGRTALLATDPPWNLNLDYDGKSKDNLPREQYLSVHREWMAEVPRILTSNGSFFLIVGGPYAHDMAVMGQALGLHLRRTVVLHNTFGQNQHDNFTSSHSFILYFVKDAKQFVFNADAIRVPSARQLVYGDKRANPKGRLPDDVWLLRPQDAPEPLFSPTGDVWFHAKVCGTFKARVDGHPCQMPLPVMERIIAVASHPGDLVVDCFSGSGTTCIAAIRTDRNFIGIEQSTEYAELSIQRIAEERMKTSQLTLKW